MFFVNKIATNEYHIITSYNDKAYETRINKSDWPEILKYECLGMSGLFDFDEFMTSFDSISKSWITNYEVKDRDLQVTLTLKLTIIPGKELSRTLTFSFTQVKTKEELKEVAQPKQTIFPISILNNTKVWSTNDGDHEGWSQTLVAKSYNSAIKMIKNNLYEYFDDIIENLGEYREDYEGEDIKNTDNTSMEYIVEIHNIVFKFNSIRELFKAKIYVDNKWVNVTQDIWDSYVEEKGRKFFDCLIV